MYSLILVLEYTNCQVFRKRTNDTSTRWIDPLFVLCYAVPLITITCCLRSSKDWDWPLVFIIVDTQRLACQISSNHSYFYAEKSINKANACSPSISDPLHFYTGWLPNDASNSITDSDTKLTQKNDEDNHNDYPTLVLQCTSPHRAMIVLLMLYYTALLVASNILAVLTIRFHANFNYSKYISFATFSLTFLWLAFIPLYVIAANTINQGPVTSFMIRISSIVTLLSLFGLRCLIMIFWPKKNVYTLDPSSTGKGLNKMIKSSLQTTKATTLDSIEAAVEEKKQQGKK